MFTHQRLRIQTAERVRKSYVAQRPSDDEAFFSVTLEAFVMPNAPISKTEFLLLASAAFLRAGNRPLALRVKAYYREAVLEDE